MKANVFQLGSGHGVGSKQKCTEVASWPEISSCALLEIVNLENFEMDCLGQSNCSIPMFEVYIYRGKTERNCALVHIEDVKEDDERKHSLGASDKSFTHSD